MGVGGGMISYLFQKIFPSLAWETEYIPEGMEAENTSEHAEISGLC